MKNSLEKIFRRNFSSSLYRLVSLLFPHSLYPLYRRFWKYIFQSMFAINFLCNKNNQLSVKYNTIVRMLFFYFCWAAHRLLMILLSTDLAKTSQFPDLIASRYLTTSLSAGSEFHTVVYFWYWTYTFWFSTDAECFDRLLLLSIVSLIF